MKQIERIQITLLCPICTLTNTVWMSPVHVASLKRDDATGLYIRPHFNCAHHVDINAPLNIQRNSDPERALHQRRRTGQRAALHTRRG